VIQGFQFGVEVTPWFGRWQEKRDEHRCATSKK